MVSWRDRTGDLAANVAIDLLANVDFEPDEQFVVTTRTTAGSVVIDGTTQTPASVD